MDFDQQIVRVEVLPALRTSRAHALLNASRDEAMAWARQKERVTWEWWRVTQSNHKAEIGVVDLGSID
jgi:hypothetical protein